MIIALQILLLVVLIVMNGVFAASETALVSSRAERLRDRAEEDGSAGARAALRLLSNPNRFLSTVQIGITLISVLVGALGGANLSGPLGEALSGVPLIGAYAGGLSFIVVVGAITYFTLIVGELVPKRLVLAAPERFSSVAAPPMSLLSRLTAPVVWLLGVSTDAVLRLVPGSRSSTESSVTEREVEGMLATGAEEGVFEEGERDLVRRALRLDDRPVSEIMTPRPAVVWLDADDEPEEHRSAALRSGFSRFPVGRGSLDDLLGVASTEGAFERALAGSSPDLLPPDAPLRDSLEQPAVVSEGAPISSSLEALRRSGVKMSIVVDERGNFEGLLTLSDVLGALFGSERAGGLPDGATQKEDGSWSLDGLLPVSELQELLDIARLPDDGGDYRTVGGMVLAAFGHVPLEGERFAWEGWRFEVADMDGFRVDEVIATRETREGLLEDPA